MLRALTFVAVRQQQSDSAALVPLLLARCNELIDDHLGGVHKVAELRLPQNHPLRRRHAVAVLKSKRARFGQGAVIDLKARLFRRKPGQRNPFLARLCIDERRVPMAESSSNCILSRNPDGSSLDQQRPKSDRYGGAPVYGHLALYHLRPAA